MIIALVLFGYLLGSIPTAEVAARWLKGIDLRQTGSGTVSGTGVYFHVARWAVVPVGLFDIFKAGLPTWMALQLGLGLAAALAAGLAAVVGHNWSLYLGFRGGRGISPFMGVTLPTFPWAFLWLLVAMAVGRLLAGTAVLALAAIFTLPALTWVSGQPTAVTVASVAMVLITVVKRLEANRLPLPAAPAERHRVLFYRLLLDRDTASWRAWMFRQPPSDHP